MLEEWPKQTRPWSSIYFQEFDGKQVSDNLHIHDLFELCFITRGTGRWQIGNVSGNFKAGTMMVYPPNTLHAWQQDGSNSEKANVGALVLRFGKESLPKSLFRVPEMDALKRFRERLDSTLIFTVPDRERLRTRLRSIDRAQGVLKVARLLVAFDLVSRYEFSEVSDDQQVKGSMTPRDSVRLDQVKRLIRDRFREPINREIAAQMVGLEETAFSRFFKKSMGTTFSDYLASYRVRHAAELLGNRRRISLVEVAQKSGFGSLETLHRQFKKHLGTTPNSYRKAANSESLAP